jgi:putative thioredoxin
MAADDSQWVINTSAETFEQDVMARSRDVPVVVDFWAPWCGPCRALGPVLERLAAEFAGRFVLVKANTDQLPQIAAQFNVSGIPAVFAVQNEQVIDFFSGALPEMQVRQWLDRVVTSGSLQSIRRLEESSPAEAASAYRALLAQDPKNADAQLSLARVLIALDELDECRLLVEDLERRGFLDAAGQRLKAQLELRNKQQADLPALRAAAQAKPDDLELQFQYAEALAGAQHFEPALETLLKLVQRDKKGIGSRARELMIQILHALPADSELAANYRRRLSMALY